MRVVVDRDIGHGGTLGACGSLVDVVVITSWLSHPCRTVSGARLPLHSATDVARPTGVTMHHSALHHRLPRAGVDVIGDSATAFAMLSTSIHRPLRHETILLLLDDARCGRAIVVVSDTVEPDAVIDVVECIADAAAGVGALVVASVRPDEDRPGGPTRDIDRWLEMSDVADAAAIDLVEWYVVGRSVRCPRDQLGEPPRW